MFEKLRSIFSAASALPPVAVPKVPNKAQAQLSFSKRTSTSKGEQKLLQSDRRTANLDLLTLRNGTSTKATIRDLAAVSPDMSAALAAYIRMVVTKHYRAVARNLDGTINPEATSLAQQILVRMGFMQDYAAGFSSACNGIHSVAEQLTRELRLYGSCCCELVLDKARMPLRLQPVSTLQIEFVDDGTGYIFPVQKINGAEVNLDFPTVFIESLDQDTTEVYSASPMEPALHASLADAEYTNDIRRTIKKSLHPRLVATIDSEKFRKQISLDVLADPEKLAEYQSNFMSSVESTVTDLEPEDSLVHFDSLVFSLLNNGNSGLSQEWDVMQNLINSKLSTGAKVPPSVLGHGAGSQNIASAEIQLFLKSCIGTQIKVNSIISRAMTLGIRLMGMDAYVSFQFDEPDLRPTSELAAFRAMEQSRILQLLSIGTLSDEEASIELTGRLPPAGAPKLSGTFFLPSSGTDPNAVDTASAQSNTGALQQGLTSDAPKAPKGPAKNAPLERVK